jgi:5,10-methylenetetrahydrofolate reductase
VKAKHNANLLLGGVAIPERHQSKGDEHLRVFNKMAQGCSFFVSQGVYDVNASKNFLSEYYYHGLENEIPLAPILFTLTPCGSAKTLQFMKWLGISFPKWLENELLHSKDILQQSVDYSEQSWLELKAFADEKNIPIGCNIESVAIRKVEVDASIELLERVSCSL